MNESRGIANRLVPGALVVVAYAGGGSASVGTIEWTMVVLVSSVIVAITFYLAVLYLVRPGEHDDEHIKRQILDEEGS